MCIISLKLKIIKEDTIMSPIVLILLICFILAMISLSFIIIKKIEKIKKFRKHQLELKEGKAICIHTFEDCQNCMVSSECVQKLGKGLLGNKG